MSSCTAGNTNGMADEAIRCAKPIMLGTATRCERNQGSNGLAVWQNVTWSPLL